jgi:hypothetical protein
MITSKQKQIAEIVRCGKDPSYFFNTYVKIQHPTRGTIPFKTYSFQDDCVQDFIDHRFTIVVKGRQLGLSTLVAAYSVWMALFHKDKNILIIATKLGVAQNFIKKSKTIIANLPEWMVLSPIVTNNRQLLELGNGSSIKAIPTSDDAGRSEALSLLIVDEAAFVRDFDTLWTGLYPTLSTGGRAIILSTPNGVGGQYYKLFTDAEAGLNEFKPIRLNWDVHPERDQVWFEKETRNLTQREIAQEYLCDFAASGETFLGDQDIEWLRNLVRPPVEKQGFDRNVWVWEYPKPGHNYVISADVSRGDGKDYSTFHICDSTSGEVVAEYKGKISPDKFGDMLVEFGTKYNEAQLCPENNSFGYSTMVRIKDLNYKKVYSTKGRGAFLGGYVPDLEADSMGFNTNSKTRPLILNKLEETLRNKRLKIYSSRFYEELKTFVWNDNKVQAMKGENDDLVMSLAIGCWLFDSDSDNTDQRALAAAMIGAMSKKSATFDGASTQVIGNDHQKKVANKRDLVSNHGQNGTFNREYLWVLRG